VLTPDDSVLEAGGAVGFLAIFSMKILGVRNYCLVEANPRLLPAISRNFALNAVNCPHVVNAAVVAADRKVSFGVNRDFWSSSMISRSGQEMLVEVPGQSLLRQIAQIGGSVALVRDCHPGASAAG
jgi:FkbM family methyltransferase